MHCFKQRNLLQYITNSLRLMANIILATIFMIVSLSIKNPASPKTIVYGFLREISKKNMELKTRDWMTVNGEHFIVKFTEKDKNIAKIVLDTAEGSFEMVNQMLRYEHHEPVPVVVYPDRSSLGKSFGWDADESAMGVYWAGVIRVLSPNKWIKDKENMEQYFRKNGPMVHEYAHLVVDYRTRGNYPRWFTEGVAQLVEKEITGFQFSSINSGSEWYSIRDMDKRFDDLPDQSLAYGQSLLMIEYLVDEYGWQALHGIMDRLAEGKTVSGAFISEIGINLLEFEKGFKQYVTAF